MAAKKKSSRRKRNTAVSVFPSTWTPGAFRVTKGGKIQVKVNPSRVKVKNAPKRKRRKR
jgi:hypothetical protein